jgi:hypothetical protein
MKGESGKREPASASAAAESYGGRRKLPPTPKRYGGRDGGQERESGNWAEGAKRRAGVEHGKMTAKLDAKTAWNAAVLVPVY